MLLEGNESLDFAFEHNGYEVCIYAICRNNLLVVECFRWGKLPFNK